MLTKVAIVQDKPVHLNLSQCLSKMMDLIQKAHDQHQPDLIAFGECWLSGYPAWLDYCPNIGNWDAEPMKEVYLQFVHNSPTIDGQELRNLCKVAKDLKVILVFGMNEKVESGVGNGTIFNSIITISDEGIVANHHRKLMPTYTEKLLHGLGDGAGLNSVKTNAGRVSAAICWEHWMPLLRQSLHNEGEDVHVAVWPMVHDRHLLASRHYAFEGRCFVLAAGQIMRVADIPSELDLPEEFVGKPDHLILNGGSCIIGPDGKLVTNQVYDEAHIVFAEIDLDQVRKESMTLDVSGHYQRWDVFNLEINKERK